MVPEYPSEIEQQVGMAQNLKSLWGWAKRDWDNKKVQKYYCTSANGNTSVASGIPDSCLPPTDTTELQCSQ